MKLHRLKSPGRSHEATNMAERRRRIHRDPILSGEIYIASPTPRFQ